MIQSATENAARQIDLDLHGFVGIRLLNPSPSDAAAVAGQLGSIEQPLDRESDITIRFVERMAIESPLRYLGVDDVGFSEDAFFVLRGKHKKRVMVQIPFEKIGDSCEIVCESGLPAVPLLIPIINVSALANDVVAMHASAFTYQGRGVLVTGWAKGGKTETLLGFMANGAEYVGDEWIYLRETDQKMFGIPEPMSIWDWHLDELPEYRRRLGRKQRTRLRTLKFTTRSMDRITSNVWGRRLLPTNVMSRLIPLLNRQRYVRVSPHQLFDDAVGPRVGSLDTILFVVSHDSPDTIIRPVDPQEIVDRMIFSLCEERKDFMSKYAMFRFAFPDRVNELVENTEHVQRRRLSRLLANKQAFVVFHPFPVSPPDLFEAIRPFIGVPQRSCSL